MTRDNVVSGRHPGFEALGIEPRGIELMLARSVRNDPVAAELSK
jgi:hypothetical protein